jgi:hypothetical protein
MSTTLPPIPLAADETVIRSGSGTALQAALFGTAPRPAAFWLTSQRIIIQRDSQPPTVIPLARIHGVNVGEIKLRGQSQRQVLLDLQSGPTIHFIAQPLEEWVNDIASTRMNAPLIDDAPQAGRSGWSGCMRIVVIGVGLGLLCVCSILLINLIVYWRY